MSEVEIRWAKNNDWFDLGFVHSESYLSTYTGIMPDEFLNGFTIENRQLYYKKTLSEGTERIALVSVNNKTIGCMVLGVCRDKDLDTYGEIYAIYLLEDYWGKGFGKRFINWGIDRLQEFGYSKVCLWVLNENINARRFYEHLGFIFDGTEKLITRGKELVQVRGLKEIYP